MLGASFFGKPKKTPPPLLGVDLKSPPPPKNHLTSTVDFPTKSSKLLSCVRKLQIVLLPLKWSNPKQLSKKAPSCMFATQMAQPQTVFQKSSVRHSNGHWSKPPKTSDSSPRNGPARQPPAPRPRETESIESMDRLAARRRSPRAAGRPKAAAPAAPAAPSAPPPWSRSLARARSARSEARKRSRGAWGRSSP